jgi:hypothetical protein
MVAAAAPHYLSRQGDRGNQPTGTPMTYEDKYMQDELESQFQSNAPSNQKPTREDSNFGTAQNHGFPT